MKINIKNLAMYIFISIISVLFMLFLDGPGGTYLVVVMAAAILISTGIFFWTKSTLSFSLKLSEDILNKGENLQLEMVLKKRGFLPTAFIKFDFLNSPLFSSKETDDYCVVIFGHDEEIIRKTLTAVFFGSGRVGTDKIIISDYLGIFSFEILNKELMNGVRIYPDIPDVSGRDSFARSLTDAVAFDESEEESASSDAVCGTPGYEHRKYNPGDNLKLINWKLSAKRGELLVRKLEGTGSCEHSFALAFDNFFFPESQLAAEAMLGLASVFAKAELPLVITICLDDKWQEFNVSNAADLQQLRYEMTSYNMFPLAANLTTEERNALRKVKYPDLSDSERAVIFAPVYGDMLIKTLDKHASGGTDCLAAVCGGDFSDDRVRKIYRESGNVRFSE